MAAALLGALFLEVSRYLSDSGDRHSTPMSAWSLESESDRKAAFESVQMAAEGSLHTMPASLVDKRKQTHMDAWAIDSWRNRLYTHFCSTPAKELTVKLKNGGYHRFIIAFDECRNINFRSRSNPAQGMSLLALQQMIRAQDFHPTKDFPFWVLFLGTDPTIAESFPLPEYASSARSHRSHLGHMSAFT